MATFTNRVTLSYNNGSTDSNIVTGGITKVLLLPRPYSKMITDYAEF